MNECPQCGHGNDEGARFCARCGAGLEADHDHDRGSYSTPVAPGTIFEGKYQVLEEIGRGGMGVVYRGQDLSLGRMVAIKVLPEQFNTDEEVIARFKKEARAMAALDHPNVVPVYAIGQQRNYHYFVMKFLAGETMAEILEQKRAEGDAAVAPRETCRIVIEMCRGLGHAHKRGLVHRDVKPGNIMLSPEGHVTIMDFGIVKEQTGGENLTRTGLVFGTPEYMAPEQAQGQATPGPTTDLYSLGVVAYEMLSGVPPFRGETPFSVVLKHIKQAPEPLVEQIPGVPQALQDVIFKALAKKPEQRFESAETMRAALEAVDFDPRPAPRVPTGELLPPPTPLPNNLPPPPDERTQPPRLGELTDEPPPGHIPARAPSGPPKPSSPTARPFIPVSQPAAPREPAMVDDRPGVYKQLITARGRQEQEKARRRNLLLVALVVVAGLTGIGLILFSLTRDDPRAQSTDSGTSAAPAVEAPATREPANDPEPPLADTDEVVVKLDSNPSGAEVYELHEGTPMRVGVTPLEFKRRPSRDLRSYSLRKEGFAEKTVNISFRRDDIFAFELQPEG